MLSKNLVYFAFGFDSLISIKYLSHRRTDEEAISDRSFTRL